jgi:co-chaperonin GroES (HSP10)
MSESIKRTKKIKTIKPIHNMVLIRHTEEQDKTSGGILLPAGTEIQYATGYVLAMPDKMKNDALEYPFKEGDKVIYDLSRRKPYTSDPRDKHYFIDASDILAVEEEEEIQLEDCDESQQETPDDVH